jgi:hypothetical protein
VVERRAGGDEVGDVGDVDPGPDAAGLAAERQGVVEVLRGLGIDRVGREVAEVDPAVERRRRDGVGLELGAGALLDEQRLEDVLDPPRAPEPALDLRPAPAGADDGEVAGPDVAEPLVVEDERDSRREVGLPDDELAAPGDLDDDRVGQTFRKRRRVSPEPSAPRPRPIPSSIRAVSGKASACTSGSLESAL